MRISDWSSDVCSSDLHQIHRRGRDRPGAGRAALSVLMMTGTSDDYGRPTGRNVTMYEDQYGLSGRPFALTPDPRFWFETATHRQAMAYLGYGLSQGAGFLVVTGDIGAGKTTLVGHLVDTIDR